MVPENVRVEASVLVRRTAAVSADLSEMIARATAKRTLGAIAADATAMTDVLPNVTPAMSPVILVPRPLPVPLPPTRRRTRTRRRRRPVPQVEKLFLTPMVSLR